MTRCAFLEEGFLMKSKLPAPSAEYLTSLVRRYERIRCFKSNEVLWSQFDLKGKMWVNKAIMACYTDCLNEGLLDTIERLP